MRHHAFAAAMGLLTAAFLAPCGQSQAASVDPTGYWYKPDAERESKIQIFKCGKSKTLLCAKIAWLKNPDDSQGRALHDIRNEDPSMRDRPIVGLMIFAGLTQSAPSTWTGQIYNPEDGHIYSATLTVLSRKEILLRGCKAWLLCGEKQWLRTTAPEELVVPVEGAQQIEASLTPQNPPAAATEPVAAAEPTAAPGAEVAGPAAPSDASLPQDSVQAMSEPEAPGRKPQSTEALSAAAAVPVQAVAAPVALPPEVSVSRGYGFLRISTEPGTTERLSGENVSSMIVMTEPLATETFRARPAPALEQKPKANPKLIATAAVKPAPKPQAETTPAAQSAPQEAKAEAADSDLADATTSQSAQADAAMADSTSLTRRQRRLLRRQQQEGPLLPWTH